MLLRLIVHHFVKLPLQPSPSWFPPHPEQVADFGAMGPVRCQACKAYVNPYMRWVDGGRNMQCCFCGATTEASVGWAVICLSKPLLGPGGRPKHAALSATCESCACLGLHGSQVPQEYQCHIGPDGERRDKFERPELCRG